VYRGNAFPSNYLGNVFVADPYAHLIHRFVLREAGLDITATRHQTRPTPSSWSRWTSPSGPVQLVNGPDGALYVVDRRNGDTSGRIWRIMPAGFTPPQSAATRPSDDLRTGGNACAPERAGTATRPRGCCMRGGTRRPWRFLEGTLFSSRIPVARLHALHALAGLGALNQRHVLTALRDTDAHIREHAVRLSERLVQGGTSPDTVWSQLRVMSADPAPRSGTSLPSASAKCIGRGVTRS